MRNITLFIWILTLTICHFCGNDFLVIRRHSWHCKARSRSSSVNDDIVTIGNTSNMDHASLYLDNQRNNQSNYIERNIQKGFLPKISGTYDHTRRLSQIIRHAKLKQRTLVVNIVRSQK